MYTVLDFVYNMWFYFLDEPHTGTIAQTPCQAG